MTISVLIPTRGRRAMLHAAIIALEHLSMGESITYVVGIDDDDVDSSVGLDKLPYTQTVVFDQNVVTNGQRYNLMAYACPADIYLLWCDDVFPMMQGWDKALVQMHAIDAVVGIYCPNEAGFAYRSITNRWLDACGYIDPEIFPFWGNDAWMREVWYLAMNCEVSLQKQFSCGGKRGKTTGYRELDFWWGCFYALRIQRLKDAWRIAKVYGVAGDNFENFVASRKNWIDLSIKNDLQRRTFIAQAEAEFGDKSEPLPRYLVAKERAVQLMAKLQLQPWQELPL